MRELLSDISSCAFVCGSSGSGKGIGFVQENILSIHESKTIPDFKPELVFVTAPALRARGETVRIINLGDVKQELLGETDYYNPLCIIADNFERPDGLHDVSDDSYEIANKLKPASDKPDEGKGANAFFEIGSQGLLSFAEQTEVLMKGHRATLGNVAALLNDRDALLHHAQWACGRLEQVAEDGKTITYATMPIEDSPWNDGRHDPESVATYIRYYRNLAKKVATLLEAQDSRTADSFLTGAQQAVERFNVSTRAHKNTSKSTFRFSEQKDEGKIVTVFIMADATRNEAQKQVMEILQWCMLTEWQRHPNHKKPVYLIADECTNFKLYKIDDLITWSRGFGVRIILIFQSFAAFRKTYGREALAVLLNESEIKLFLPNQRDPETLDLLERSLLGQQSYVADGRSGNVKSTDYRITGFDYREDGKPLMTVDQIRRTNKAILFIRRCRPVLVNLPSIAAIHPFRDQIDINPFHGKPYRLPVELVLDRDGKSRKSIWQRIKRCFAARPASNPKRKLRYLKRSLMAFRASNVLRLWWIALILALLASPVGPHLLIWYEYSQYSGVGSKITFNCQYLGSRGVIKPDVSADCPLLVFIDSRDWR